LVLARIDRRERSEYALDSMIPMCKQLRILIFLPMVLVLGCAHKYTEEEYQNIVNQLSACSQEVKAAKEESAGSSKNIAQVQKRLDQMSQDLGAAINEKQELLDRNIQCLEEKKALIKKLSQSSIANQEKKEAQARMNKGYEYISSLMEPERLNDNIYIIRTQEKIKIVIPQKTLFPTSTSAWLTPKGTKLVKKIALGLKQMSPSSIEISGHTDGTFVTDQKNSAYSTNWHLAMARALSVLQIFEESHVKKDRMCAISYGDAKPITDNATPEGKSMNRRVEIVITP
jgi:chemotaxis protein MotB